MTTTTHRIPAQNLEALKEHVAKLNKRVAKLNKKGYDVKPVELAVNPVPEITKRGNKEFIVYTVSINAEPVQAGGWEFIGTLQHEEGGTIVRAVPGATQEGELAQFRDAKPICQHCGWDRKRNDTFILRKVA